MRNAGRRLEEAGQSESVNKATGGAVYIWRVGAAAQQKDIFAPAHPTVANKLSQTAEGLGSLFPRGPFTIYFGIIIQFFAVFAVFAGIQRISPYGVDDPRGGALSRVSRNRMIKASGLPRKALVLEGLLLGDATFG
jgi:hypothetical protein